MYPWPPWHKGDVAFAEDEIASKDVRKMEKRKWMKIPVGSEMDEFP